MTVMEAIVRDLKGLPPRKPVEVARYVHGLSESATSREREQALRETHGYLSESDAQIFEDGLENSRRLEATPKSADSRK